MLKWDHIIHHINHLSSFSFPDEMLKVIPGGRHEKLGTYNQLSYFDLSYIEFIDAFDRQLIHDVAASKEGRLSFAASLERTDYREGFIRLCFRTDDILDLKQRLELTGYKVIGPLEMSRTKPDGSVIAWQLLYIDDDRTDRELPFFIQWGTTDAERSLELMPLFQSASVSEITLVTKDKEALIEEWQKLFDAEYNDGFIMSGSPLFTVVEGDREGIESITIIGEKYINEKTMDVHGGKYIFKRRRNHTSA